MHGKLNTHAKSAIFKAELCSGTQSQLVPSGCGFCWIPCLKDGRGRDREENSMSTQTQVALEMGTKPVNEHQWLQKLVGEWRVEMEMAAGTGQPGHKSESTESVKSLGGFGPICR
jgi:hypothetical protein